MDIGGYIYIFVHTYTYMNICMYVCVNQSKEAVTLIGR